MVGHTLQYPQKPQPYKYSPAENGRPRRHGLRGYGRAYRQAGQLVGAELRRPGRQGGGRRDNRVPGPPVPVGVFWGFGGVCLFGLGFGVGGGLSGTVSRLTYTLHLPPERQTTTKQRRLRPAQQVPLLLPKRGLLRDDARRPGRLHLCVVVRGWFVRVGGAADVQGLWLRVCVCMYMCSLIYSYTR